MIRAVAENGIAPSDAIINESKYDSVSACMQSNSKIYLETEISQQSKDRLSSTALSKKADKMSVCGQSSQYQR